MPETQTNLAWETLLDLGDGDSARLHDRLRQALRAAIRSGRLPVGSALPPSRTLAGDLGCSRWAVTEAYAQLIAEGFLEGRAGSATRVRWTVGDRAEEERAPEAGTHHPRFDMTPVLPDLRAFPRARWAAALRSQATRVPFPDLGYPPWGGHPRLRRVMAEYLRRCRAAAAGEGDLMISTGVLDGLVRVAGAMLAAGFSELAVEHPSEYAGDTRLHHAVASTGLRLVPLPVDEKGLVVEALAARRGLRAVLVTPAHQFPTGTVLAPARRAALLDWARRVDGVVLEDDYDAEFRYDRRPVATLQGMDPSRVCLFGSLSKTMSPALRIGWLVTPPRWTALLRRPAISLSGPPVLDQLAFAQFVESGAYDRHVRASRQRYRRRRDAVVAALGRRLPGCQVSGAAAGLHVLLHLPDGVDAGAAVSEALRRGVETASMETFRGGGGCLVLGYGNLGDAEVEAAVDVLASALERVRG